MSGLRAQKKQQTREAIAAAAADLFHHRGFENVTVDDVAHAAGVSRQTVFNYFPSKEQMLFDRDAEIEALLLAAVRDRPPGTSITSAFRAHTERFWLRLHQVLRHGPLPHGFWEVVSLNPGLRDYAEATFARQAIAVGAALAAETGADHNDPVCQAAARALCGTNVSLLTYGLDRLIAGDDPETVIADVLAAAQRAYDLLEHGITGF
jgi:AcrR family transcriptional regulator